MTAVTPKQIAASALTLLLMAADTMTVATRPSSTRRGNTLEQVEAYASSLGAGETAVHSLTFEKGREYHLEAACADGCSVDMQLFSSSGRELDRHVGAAGTPEVAIITSNTGSYRAEVKMVACRVQPCAYTLAVFAR
jgi:hypothetical protein